MEIRRCLVLIALTAASLLRAEPNVAEAGSVIRVYPLNPKVPYAVRIGTDEPTTCVFPGALSALEAAGISAKAEDQPPVLIAYQPGASFFSVRALRPNAQAAVNAVYQGHVFVLNFAARPVPDRSITFAEEVSGQTPAYQRPGAEALGRMIAWSKQYLLIAAQHPALAERIGHAAPKSVNYFRNFTVTVEDVYRFETEDCLIFRLALRSTNGAEATYDAAGLAVRVGIALYRADLVEASGIIPAHGTTEAYLAIAGSPDGVRANLSVKNVFSVVVPRTA